MLFIVKHFLAVGLIPEIFCSRSLILIKSILHFADLAETPPELNTGLPKTNLTLKSRLPPSES